jgi:hypothetical protein
MGDQAQKQKQESPRTSLQPGEENKKRHRIGKRGAKKGLGRDRAQGREGSDGVLIAICVLPFRRNPPPPDVY